MASGFSFLPKKDLISYADGVKQGLGKAPDRIKKKVESGKKLGAMDSLQWHGRKELETEIMLPKEERMAWIEIVEDHDYLPYQYLLDADPPNSEEIHEKGEKFKTKTVDGTAEGQSLNNYIMLENDNEVSGGTDQIKLKRTRKEEKLSNADEEVEKMKKDSKRPKIDPVVSNDHEKDETRKSVNVVNLDRKSSEPEITSKSDSDSDDSLFINTLSEIIGDKQSEAPVPCKTSDEGLVNTGIDNKQKVGKMSQEEIDKRCMKSFLPIMNRLKNAVEINDVTIAKEYLGQIQQHIQLFTPLIITQPHTMVMLVRSTKVKFSDNKDLVALAESVTRLITSEYNENRIRSVDYLGGS